MAQRRYPAAQWKRKHLWELQHRFGETYKDCLSGWSAAAKTFLKRYQAIERMLVDLPITAGEMSLEVLEWQFRNGMSILAVIEENDLYEWVEVR